MVAAQLLKQIDIHPMWAAVSLGLIAGAYVFALLPSRVRRVVAAPVLAVVLGGLLVARDASANVVFPPLECCANWWAYFGVCWPMSWGC